MSRIFILCLTVIMLTTACFALDIHDPKGNVSVSQGIIVSSRLHAAVNNNSIPASEEQCISYAISNSLIKSTQFEELTRPIKRFEMAELLSLALGEVAELNTIDEIPDVLSTAPYAPHALKLYKAGIITGYDDYGTFEPDNNLTRFEMSAMTERAANSALRVRKSFFKLPKEAYCIIEAVRPSGSNGLANGWKYDNRFDLFNTTGRDKSYISDASGEKFASLIRDFKTESDGSFRLELIFNASSGENGIYAAFEDKNQNKLFGLKVQDGILRLFGNDTSELGVEISQSETNTYAVEINFSLDDNTAAAYINNTDCGSVSIPNSDISRLVLGTSKEGFGSISAEYVRLSKNYAVNHRFLAASENMGQTPCEWTVYGDFKLQNIASMHKNDLTSVVSNTKAGQVSTAYHGFGAVSGKVSFETMILLPQKTDGASVSLMSGDVAAVTFETRDGGIYVGDILVNDYIANVWQTLHVEADTVNNTADIYVNGKYKATINIENKYFDGIRVGFSPAVDACMWFDDVEVYNIIDHEDYPSSPIVSQSSDYNIGVNVCWLWRDGQSGEGWDSVSAFSEFDTYLGFYDEGLRETADWEIKWLAEHGVDFMHTCWYCPSNDIQAPIKEMRTSYAALHDGYMMAKYSDLVDFCIMWENSAQDCTSFEQFKEYIWNYWVEYYFKDQRYVRLDNKALLSVFNVSNFEKAFGGQEGARQAVQFMNDELKKLGYDGLILMTNVSGIVGADTFTKRASLGFDSHYAYNWGRKGSQANYQIQCNNSNAYASSGIMHHIPTISMGFNDVGRNEVRSPIISVDEHLQVCESVKQSLASYNTGTWKDNTLILSTLNEYSEGTYMFPTATTGFDYLENVRKTFTNDTQDHTGMDVRPTQEQVERVTHLYPENHSPIRWLQYEKSSEQKRQQDRIDNAVCVRTYDMTNPLSTAMWKSNHGLSSYDDTKGVISGTSTASDYAIVTSASFEQVSALDASVLHIRMKNNALSYFEVYFVTDKDSTWDDNKRVLTQIEVTGEFYDYYVDMTQNPLWKDNITKIRIDPQMSPGSFEIALIELLRPDELQNESPVNISVNGVELDFTFDPQITSDGDYEIVGEARNKGFYSAMRLYYEWDRFTGDGVLTLKSYDENTYVFTVGSDKVLVNGIQRDMGYTFTLRDGLPVFRIKKLCELLGYDYTENESSVQIKAGTQEDCNLALEVNQNNKWDFNEIIGEAGWVKRSTCFAMVNLQGFMEITPNTSTDIGITRNTDFEASKYTKIRVGVKYSDALKNASAQMFFITDSDTVYDESKSFVVRYDLNGKTYGDTVEVVFDLTKNAQFSGIIKELRFDPFNKRLGCEIDYIICE